MEDMRFAAAAVCRECRLAPPSFEKAVGFAEYEDELRGLIGLLKFGRVHGVAGLLGDAMTQTVLQLESHAARELLVIAVPLFVARERQRGYNQSVLIADVMIARMKRLRPTWKLVAAHGSLIRVKSTESSFSLSRRDRRRNLAGAFRVAGNVRGREVLLIDDIYTSGATARECAKVLMRAGATKVWVATLARAQKQEFSGLRHDPGEQVAAWDMVPPNQTSGHGEMAQ